jgi:hypothetical protein
MDETQVTDSEPRQAWMFLATKWYGYLLSLCFLLYGGVKIILGVLDRDYSDISSSVLFLILGIILITICMGYRDRRRWGWYGLIGVNAIVVVLAAIGYSQALNLIYLVLSGAALAMLFAPKTKAEIF